MKALARSVHVFAVAVWLGSVVFFTITGLLVFRSFAEVSREETRPEWLPLPPIYAQPSPGPGFPDPLRLEQGSRAAGEALSSVFVVYYGLQAMCGAVLILTIVYLGRFEEGGPHMRRTIITFLAVLTVWGGWWLEIQVSRLRETRNRLTDEVLTMTAPPAEKVEAARQARAAFGTWHGYSLVQNFATLGLVVGLTLLVPSLCRGTRSG